MVPLSTEEFGAFGSGAGTGDVLLLLERYMLVWDEAGRGLAWPPERNAACWCGSQRKYKKCCGAPGFAEEPSSPAEG
ncbi:SEC-C metal-binding domain-containing protein [Salinifilum ghardaiensis]